MPIKNNSRLAWLELLLIALLITAVFESISTAGSQDKGNNLPDTVLAVVNDDLIRTSDFDRIFMNLHRKQSTQQKDTFDYRKLLNKLINDRLLIQEAIALGFDTDEQLLKQLNEDRIQNAIRQFFRENFKPDLNIGEDAVLAYFTSNYYRMQIRSISLIDSLASVEVYRSLLSGCDMDSLAREVSLDMYRYKGGLQNLKYYADIEVELRDRAVKLKPGEINRPIPFRTGFTVIRLENRVPADTAELGKLRNKIESFLKQREIESASRDFIEYLYSEYPVKEDSRVIEKIYADSSGIFTQQFGQGTGKIAIYHDDNFLTVDTEIRNKISHMAMTSAQKPLGLLIADGIQKAKDDLVIKTAAITAGYLENTAVMDIYQHSMDSALIELYLQDTVLPGIVFNRAEFDSYYEEHREDFRKPAQYKMDELLIADEATAHEIEKALAEGADFDFQVKSHNLAISSGNDQRSWVTLESYPEIIKAQIESLKIGDATAAYPTGDGWLIIRIKDSRPGEINTIDEVDMKIREAMFQMKFTENLDNALKVLKENSSVILNQKGIDKYLDEK